MTYRTSIVLSTAAAFLVLCAAPFAVAGGKKKAQSNGSLLTPVTLGRKAQLAPVTRGRAAGLAPVTRGRAASLKGISNGRAENLAPVTRGRAVELSPVTTGRAVTLPGISLGRAANLAPVTRGRAVELSPVTRGRAVMLPGISLGRAANLSPVTRGRAVELSPVTRDRAAELSPISFGRAVHLASLTYGEDLGVSNLFSLASDSSIIGFSDGFLAPYSTHTLAEEGYFHRVFSRSIDTPYYSASIESNLTTRFSRAGFGPFVLGRGSVYTVLDALDPYGPQHLFRRPLGHNVPRGVRFGRFYFPAAYFIRPLSCGYNPYNKGHRLFLVPRDCTEVVPDDFYRTLRKSHFPMVIGDMAFKSGNYVQATLAFREAFDRDPKSVAARFALGDGLIALRNYGYAADMIHAGLEEAPKWADHLNRHGVYGIASDFDKHMKEVARFTKDYPESEDGWFLLGYLRMTSGSAKLRHQAVGAFRHALELVPNDGDALRYLKMLQAQAGPTSTGSTPGRAPEAAADTGSH